MRAEEPKYALYPGEVESRTDGQWHFIGAAKLAMLYGVPMALCLVVRREDFRLPYRRELIEHAAKLIPLGPRYNGDYSLPKAP